MLCHCCLLSSTAAGMDGRNVLLGNFQPCRFPVLSQGGGRGQHQASPDKQRAWAQAGQHAGPAAGACAQGLAQQQGSRGCRWGCGLKAALRPGRGLASSLPAAAATLPLSAPGGCRLGRYRHRGDGIQGLARCGCPAELSQRPGGSPRFWYRESRSWFLSAAM